MTSSHDLPTPPGAPNPGAQTGRKGNKVLLVEDIVSDAITIKSHLTSGHYRSFDVHHVSTTEAAVEAARSAEYDAVLMDLSLSDPTDISEVMKLRSAVPQLPLVILTGWNNEALGRRALQAGAEDYLPKNELTAAALVRIVSNAIERHRIFWHLREVIARSADAMVVVDGRGKIQLVNRAAMALFQGDAEKLLGRGIGAGLQGGQVKEITVPQGDGSTRVAEMRVVDIEWNGAPAHLICLRDLTRMARLAHELKVANSALGEMLTTDALAQTLNRRGLENALAVELERLRRTGSNLAVVLIFCDDVKTAGSQPMRDAIARTVADQLRQIVRQSDHLGRVGDDTFLLLLPDTRLAEAAIVGEKIESVMREQTFSRGGVSQPIRVSVGWASAPDHKCGLRELFTLSKNALQARRPNAGRLIWGATPVPQHPATSSLELPAMGACLAAGQLRVVPHKIMRLRDESAVGCEMLVRGPPGPLESPVALFNTARDAGALTALDLACLEACVAAMPSLAPGARCHINLFPSTIMQTPTDTVLEVLARGGKRGAICLELSEDRFVGDPAVLADRLRAFRDAHVQIAIDDVGFGRSSLEVLLVIAPEVVKIDRRFVDGIAGDAQRERLLRRFVGLVRGGGAMAIAEGIESREDCALIKDMGVEYAQGYLWGKPGEQDQQSAPVLPTSALASGS